MHYVLSGAHNDNEEEKKEREGARVAHVKD